MKMINNGLEPILAPGRKKSQVFRDFRNVIRMGITWGWCSRHRCCGSDDRDMITTDEQMSVLPKPTFYLVIMYILAIYSLSHFNFLSNLLSNWKDLYFTFLFYQKLMTFSILLKGLMLHLEFPIAIKFPNLFWVFKNILERYELMLAE